MWGVPRSVCSSPSRILKKISVSTSPSPQGPHRRVPPTSKKPTFFKRSESWHVRYPQKRLLKPVKNFEKKIHFDLSRLPGTLPKGPPRPPKIVFFQSKQKVARGVSSEASAQACLFPFRPHPRPQGTRLRVP